MQFGLCPWSGLWPETFGAEPEPRAQPNLSIKVGGEAEPRLTSGGEAGVDGVKFHDRVLIFKWCLTSGGEAGEGESSFTSRF